MEANRGWLRIVAVILGVAVLLWGNQISMERLWWSLATVVVGMAAIQILVGAGKDTLQATDQQRLPRPGSPATEEPGDRST